MRGFFRVVKKLGIYLASGQTGKSPFKGLDRFAVNDPKYVGFGPGKFAKAIKFLVKYRKPITGIGAIAVGAGFAGLPGGTLDEARDKLSQTYSSGKFANYRRANDALLYRSNRNRRGRNRTKTCCCGCCH